MGGADWYLLAWKRAFDIRGRSRRKEFAYFFIVSALVGLLLLGIGGEFGSDETQTIAPTHLLLGLYFAAIIVPKITLNVRRLHDVEMSGWLALLGLVPYAGLVLDVFCLIAPALFVPKHCEPFSQRLRQVGKCRVHYLLWLPPV